MKVEMTYSDVKSNFGVLKLNLLEIINECIDDSFVNQSEIPEELFKYRRWRMGCENIYDDDVLEKLELFFANPESFEDKEDCKMRVDYSLFNENHSLFKKFHYKRAIEKLVHEDGKKYNEISFKEFEAKLVGMKSELGCFNSLKEWEYYCNITGVLSMCKNDKSAKMWESEFAKQFTGVCYGFNTRKLFNDLGLNIENRISHNHVKYYKKLNFISPMKSTNFKIYRRKFDKLQTYSFEEEFRLSISEKNISLPVRTRKFTIEAISKIIFGHNMSKENFEDFIRVLNKQGGENIPLYYTCLEADKIYPKQIESQKYWK